MVEGKVVYDGMSTILSASRQIYNASSTESEPGFCTYSFVFDVDQDGTTLSWAMHDDPDVALNSVKEVVNSSLSHLEAKTKKMNDILNDDVPYFRCSDDDIVKVKLTRKGTEQFKNSVLNRTHKFGDDNYLINFLTKELKGEIEYKNSEIEGTEYEYNVFAKQIKEKRDDNSNNI